MFDRTCRCIRRYCLASLLLPALLAGGCGPQSQALPTYMRPELLYVGSRPYASLYVEVDVVEGIDVPQAWLDEFRAFLERHCDKPEGITIVRDEPVPQSEITGMPLDLAAVHCADGPPDGEPKPAYLHVLFYDSSKWTRQKARPPYVYGPCPCAILCDMNHAAFRYLKDRAAGFILRHEAGHVLGLCKDRTHGDGAHCRNWGCLMQQSPDLPVRIGIAVGLPLTLKGDLCNACTQNLQAIKSQADPNNLSFMGPFLVRREAGYTVASLPGYEMLVLGSARGALAPHAMLARAKESMKNVIDKVNRDARLRSKGMLYAADIVRPVEMGADSEPYHAIMARAAEDPNPRIRRLAREKLQALKAPGQPIYNSISCGEILSAPM